MREVLGREATDKITGFKGVIVGHVRYLTGCDQYLVQPRSEKPSERPEASWFDENRVIIDMSVPAIELQPAENDRGGPDRPAPRK